MIFFVFLHRNKKNGNPKFEQIAVNAGNTTPPNLPKGEEIVKENTSQIIESRETVEADRTTTTAGVKTGEDLKPAEVKVEQVRPSAPEGEAPSEDITQIQGLLYTIQIGAYSKPQKASRFFGIQPLYLEKNENGLHRYTTGIYTSVAGANEARNVVVNIGIRDAFVKAYNNGKLITIEEAAQIQAAGGSSVLVKASDVNKMPNNGKMKILNTPEAATDPSATGNFKKGATNANLKFKVQIGAFKEEVPIEIAAIFMKIASKGIDHFLRNDGFTVYTLGSFANYDEANVLKNELSETDGLKDAFIVPFFKGKAIPMSEAERILNK